MRTEPQRETRRGDVTAREFPRRSSSVPSTVCGKKRGTERSVRRLLEYGTIGDNSLFGIFEVDANFRLDASGDHYLANYVAY